MWTSSSSWGRAGSARPLFQALPSTPHPTRRREKRFIYWRNVFGDHRTLIFYNSRANVGLPCTFLIYLPRNAIQYLGRSSPPDPGWPMQAEPRRLQSLRVSVGGSGRDRRERRYPAAAAVHPPFGMHPDDTAIQFPNRSKTLVVESVAFLSSAATTSPPRPRQESDATIAFDEAKKVMVNFDEQICNLF